MVRKSPSRSPPLDATLLQVRNEVILRRTKCSMSCYGGNQHFFNAPSHLVAPNNGERGLTPGYKPLESRLNNLV